MFKANCSPCALGKDSCGPPGVDSKIEESSDIPILEDTSSSPTDCPQLCWLVATDIENIEKYVDESGVFVVCVCLPCTVIVVVVVVIVHALLVKAHVLMQSTQLCIFSVAVKLQ